MAEGEKREAVQSKSSGSAESDEATQRDEVKNGDRRDDTGPKGSHRRETYRVAIVAALLGAVATAVLGSVSSPVRDWSGGALDSVHDFFLSYNGEKVDNMKETVEGRPFWQNGPSFEEGSLDYLSNDPEEPVSILEERSAQARVIGVDELIAEAPELDGVPIVLAGKLQESSVLGGDNLTLNQEEHVFQGDDHYAYVGSNSYTSPYDGFRGVVAVVGVLVATGQALHSGVPAGVETAYFISLAEIPVRKDDPAFQPVLRDLVPARYLKEGERPSGFALPFVPFAER